MRVMISALAAALALLAVSDGFGQQPWRMTSAASTNSTLVKAGPTKLHGGLIVNTTGVVYYVKFYNKATAPTCGTDVPAWTVAAPTATGQNVTAVGGGGGGGTLFTTGLGICITAGFADNDVAVAATGVIVNLNVE